VRFFVGGVLGFFCVCGCCSVACGKMATELVTRNGVRLRFWKRRKVTRRNARREIVLVERRFLGCLARAEHEGANVEKNVGTLQDRLVLASLTSSVLLF
jgi:hypothetical protein